MLVVVWLIIALIVAIDGLWIAIKGYNEYNCPAVENKTKGEIKCQ